MAAATNSTEGTIVLGGDLHGSDANFPELSPTGVTPGVYTTVQKMHVDAKGRITNIIPLQDDEKTSIIDGMQVATAALKGVCKIGANISVVAGVIGVEYASDAVAGVVRPGVGLTLSAGILSADTITLPDASTSISGGVIVGSNIDVTSGVISIPVATNTTLGVAKSGVDTTCTASGQLDISTNIPLLSSNSTFTMSQVSEKYVDTYSASYTPDFSLSNVIELVLTGDVTINAPINAVAGGVYTIILTQDGTGSRLLTSLNGVYKTNAAITLSTAAGNRDIITFVCKDSTTFYTLFLGGYA